ncbi:M23 family metallopeptidase [Nanoarchaeota archaeon]
MNPMNRRVLLAAVLSGAAGCGRLDAALDSDELFGARNENTALREQLGSETAEKERIRRLHNDLVLEIGEIDVQTTKGTQSLDLYLDGIDPDTETTLLQPASVLEILTYSTPVQGLTYDKIIERVQSQPERNFHYIGEYGATRGQRKHTAIDIPAELGSPLLAITDGEVVHAGPYKIKIGNEDIDYGNIVLINHGSFSTLYAHVDKVYVNENDKVEKGQQIATIGRTGNAKNTAPPYNYPHVHFEVLKQDTKYQDGKIINHPQQTQNPLTILSLIEGGPGYNQISQLLNFE